jgi:hypothetical protein
MINLFSKFYNFLEFSRIFLIFLRFSQFIKKINRTGPCLTRGSPAPEGQQWDELDFSEFDLSRLILYEPDGPCQSMTQPDLVRTRLHNTSHMH